MSTCGSWSGATAVASPCDAADALPLLRSGRVDRRLFDVTGLIEAGYDDAHRDNLPLLVAYRSRARPGGRRPAARHAGDPRPAGDSAAPP